MADSTAGYLGGFKRTPSGALMVSGGGNQTGYGDVETLDRKVLSFAGSGAGIAAGDVQASYAQVLKGGTFGQITFRTGAQAITACTDFRVGVFDAAGVPTAQSANASATVTAPGTVYTVPLLAPIVLEAGEFIYIGAGGVGTSVPDPLGFTGLSGIDTLAPVLSLRKTGWAGGVLPTLDGGSPVRHRWFRLVP